MTRDHKLILGGGLCGGAGALFGLGLGLLAAAVGCVGVVMIAAAGKA